MEAAGHELGGKAKSLEWLAGAGLTVPRWTVLSPGPDSIEEGEPTAALLTELDRKLRREFGDRYAEREFAVRSSVADEDGDKHSFAGQMDSFLFQRGLSAIARSVLRVLESARSDRA